MDLSVLTPKNLTITTKRLSIYPMLSEHKEEFKQLQCDENLMAFIGPILDENALSDKFNQRISCFEDNQQWFTLLINERKDSSDVSPSKFIGSVGFRLVDIECQRVEIGYLALSASQGKGCITEAGDALIHFLKEKLKVKKIVANCAVENIASWKVMEKMGLQKEGTLKADFKVNENWFDAYTYALVF